MPVENKDIFLSTILDSIAEGVFTVDREWRVTSFNRAAEEITGIPREQAIGSLCREVFRSNICETECALRQTIETGRQIINRHIYIVRADGETIPISISTAVLMNEQGELIGGVETFRDLSAFEELRKQLNSSYALGDIVSKNHEMRRLFEILPGIAESDSTVLIEGESGTGKELFARSIHDLSLRAEKPMVTVNCGALPDNLLESELFGHVKGAFTGATRDRKGRFAIADGGTIFLDEIGEVSPALQVRLLRVLQEHEFEPLGSEKPVKVDIRVIAATNRNLDDMVQKGEFRQDLYYRINVMQLLIPPLRDRKEDIPLLVDHFIQRFNRLKEKDIAGVSDRALLVLMRHDYPGNIRELENIIEHAFVMCRAGLIELEHLPRQLVGEIPPATFSTGAVSLDENEAMFLTTALERNQWNVAATSKELGLHRTTLWRKIKKFGIEIPKNDR
ncbi:MAG TPA: sigma 54-interacting transcriptional regulator [bacterium]|nr:sigma 54-interacting transcriptional regulator [bacterium]